MMLYCVNNTIRHWYVALTSARIIQIIVEILICAIHPFPHGIVVHSDLSSKINHVNSTMSGPTPIPLSYIPIDVALGLPMFARLYLLCRAITFHSRFLRDSSSRSLGYLNKVPINFFFIIKAYLEQSPALCLIIFFMLMFCIRSWSLRACNYTTTHQHLPIGNAMWMFMTLFTTVGYGDLIPSTYCGRGVATITAIIGVMISAFLIAVLSQKLLLNRWEKYIYNFGLNIELAKRQRFYAANIIHYAWKAWRLNDAGMQRSIEYVYVQRKLFGAIAHNQQLKQEQRQLTDHHIGLAELMTAHRETSTKSVQIEAKIASMTSKMNRIEDMLKDMKGTIEAMDNRLNLLLDKSTST